MRAVFLPAPARLAAGLLRVVSCATLLAIAAVLVWPEAGPVNPLWLIRVVVSFCLLPRLAVLLLDRTFGGTLRVEAGSLVLEQRHGRVEIPVEAIAAIDPWRVPVPGSGVSLRLRSGRRWSDGIAMHDPVALLDMLVEAGGSPDLLAAARHPSVVHAHARSSGRRSSWHRPLLDFPVFALLPTLPLFRVHQIIAYGGALGEYHQYGLGAWLAGFVIYWATLTIYLMAYAAALRVPVEAFAFGAAVLAPLHARTVRRALDGTAAVLYYGGVPAAVVLRFLPW